MPLTLQLTSAEKRRPIPLLPISYRSIPREAINRAVLWDAFRRQAIGGFKAPYQQVQVDAVNYLLNELAKFDIESMAHVLAEVCHETGGWMAPIKETVMPHHKDKNPSDATVIQRLDSAFAAGRLGSVRAPYWREGWFGRGGIQLTHQRNYAGVGRILRARIRQAIGPQGVQDLDMNRDLALRPDVSAIIAVHGCDLGLFTGKELNTFRAVDGFRHYDARAIVNGDKDYTSPGNRVTNGEIIVDLALQFRACLYESLRPGFVGVPQSSYSPADDPATLAESPPPSTPSTPSTPSSSAEPTAKGFLAWLATIFGKR